MQVYCQDLLDYFVDLYLQGIVYFQDVDLKVYLFEIYCSVSFCKLTYTTGTVQFEILWFYPLVPPLSPPQPPQQTALPLAAAAVAAIICHKRLSRQKPPQPQQFSPASCINQFVHAFVYLPSQAANLALSGRTTPQNCRSKSSRTVIMFVLRTYQYVPVNTSIYPYVLVHVLSYTVMYCNVP